MGSLLSARAKKSVHLLSTTAVLPVVFSPDKQPTLCFLFECGFTISPDRCCLYNCFLYTALLSFLFFLCTDTNNNEIFVHFSILKLCACAGLSWPPYIPLRSNTLYRHTYRIDFAWKQRGALLSPTYCVRVKRRTQVWTWKETKLGSNKKWAVYYGWKTSHVSVWLLVMITMTNTKHRRPDKDWMKHTD